MKTMTVLELQRIWTGVERRLRANREALLGNCDGEPVAQILPLTFQSAGTPPSFTAAAHRASRYGRWASRAPKTDSSRWLTRERAERRSRDKR